MTYENTFKEGDLVKMKHGVPVLKGHREKIFTIKDFYENKSYCSITDGKDSWLRCLDELEHVVTDESIKESARRILEDEAVRDLLQIESLVRDKAKKYDLIAETFFMACGIIEDGGSIKYIVDPETVCNAILNILVNDINIDKDRIVQKKRDAVNRDLNW